MKNQLGAFWGSERSLSILLWILGVTLFAVVPVVVMLGSPEWEKVVLAVFFSALMLSGVLSAWSDRATRRYVLWAAAVPLTFLWLEMIYRGKFLTFVGGGLRLAVVLVFAAVLFGRVLASGPVTMYRIKGAVAVYLLLGLVWAEAYRLISIVDSAALTVQSSNPLSVKYTAELLYFSFSTLTTAGYGDIVPVHPLARSLANVEAIAGQMYVVLLIGRLVSLHMAQSGGESGSKR